MPSRRGWMMLLLLFCGATMLFVHGVHPFLALTKRVDAEYLVVEGWVPNYALSESIEEFRSQSYRLLFTVGSRSLDGVDIEDVDNQADHAAKRLKWLGMQPELIQPVPAQVLYNNRTYRSALALRHWIEERKLPVTSFNVVTVGPHARRSRLLFEKAFNGKARVGIISVANREYDAKQWWRGSEGVKQILSEGVAYLYYRLAFWP